MWLASHKSRVRETSAARERAGFRTHSNAWQPAVVRQPPDIYARGFEPGVKADNELQFMIH
jgi:hypothetical protein